MHIGTTALLLLAGSLLLAVFAVREGMRSKKLVDYAFTLLVNPSMAHRLEQTWLLMWPTFGLGVASLALLAAFASLALYGS